MSLLPGRNSCAAWLLCEGLLLDPARIRTCLACSLVCVLVYTLPGGNFYCRSACPFTVMSSPDTPIVSTVSGGLLHTF